MAKMHDGARRGHATKTKLKKAVCSEGSGCCFPVRRGTIPGRQERTLMMHFFLLTKIHFLPKAYFRQSFSQ